MSDDPHLSWGRIPRVTQIPLGLNSRSAPLPPRGAHTMLPHGLGRSYGDSCLNDGGALLLTRGLDRWISFDEASGVLRCEAGVSLAEILALCVPKGWFLPVTPGTKFVTVGGAIANDVHGKNHHRAGTFGRHTRCFELLRSDGSRRLCSRGDNATWFRATVGGLGLTGLITWAEIQLQRIHNPLIDSEKVRFRNLAEFVDLAQASDKDFAYTVAWVDCLAAGENLGRGIFMRGNHAGPEAVAAKKRRKLPPLPVPFDAPGFLLNQQTVRAFNTLYAKTLKGDRHRGFEHYEPFFYPLDGLANWNRLYGKRGFFQHQCVVPLDGHGGPIKEILRTIAESGQASFLAVLKLFGDLPPEGLLSFPRPGITLALDFPNRGTSTRELMDRLDHIVAGNGGALYPAKDARMSGAHFRQFFPALDHFQPFIDPAFSSSFWRRVMATSPENPA